MRTDMCGTVPYSKSRRSTEIDRTSPYLTVEAAVASTVSLTVTITVTYIRHHYTCSDMHLCHLCNLHISSLSTAELGRLPNRSQRLSLPSWMTEPTCFTDYFNMAISKCARHLPT